MRRIILLTSIFFLILFTLLVPTSFAASPQRPVISVINPLREPNMVQGAYTLSSLQSQWEVTKKYNIPATWLWQYQTLQDGKLVSFAKTRMQGQEFGLFLEVDRSLAAKAAVGYRGQGPWYFSDGLLLVSYDQEERQKLIDADFSSFKQTFGYYPKTVGAWWIGEDSITYMHEKYGVVAVLRAADQYDLDAYAIWGTPWSIPYVSSRTNEGAPAESFAKSSQVVILQWAARDPTQAYGTTFSASTYSIQDYALKGYTLTDFDYLAAIFLHRPMDQLVIGLEGGNPPIVYTGQYQEQVAQAANWQKAGKIAILPAGAYATEFLSLHKTLAPTHYFLANDYHSQDQSFWYNTSLYRVGIEKHGDTVSLVDVRDYAAGRPEDFTLLPNSQGMLRINEPSLIDSARLPNQQKILATTTDALRIATTGATVRLFAGKTLLAVFNPHTMTVLVQGTKSTNTFIPNSPWITAFGLLSVLLLVYSVYIFFCTKSWRVTALHTGLLVFPLFVALPFISSRVGQQSVAIFDRKELFLFFLPLLSILPLPWHLLLLAVIPFFLLIVAHAFLLLSKRTQWKNITFFLFYGLLLLLYAHVPYFPVDRSTYKFIGVFFVAFSVLSLTLIAVLFYQTKKIQIFLVSIAVFCLVLGGLVVTILFSRQQYVLTPFEIDALSYVHAKKETLYAITPPNSLIYKAVRPIFYDYPTLVMFAVGGRWQPMTEVGDTVLQLEKVEHGIIFVPRYLGASVDEGQIEKYHLQKIFDNAQIVMYQK